jgi:adenylosuccinate lyase
MIARYTRPEMGRIWAAAEALAEAGVVPPEAARRLREHARCDPARVDEIEREVKHDVIAFTTAAASRWFHYGLTSNEFLSPARRFRAVGHDSRLG